MNRSFLILLALAAGLLVATPARAAGTHFIFEGGGGISVTDVQSTGPFWDLCWGYGGKFRGFPPRFYILANYSGAAVTGEGSAYQRSAQDHSLLFGPRIYLPIARNLRIFGHALFGKFWADADWTIRGLEQYHTRDEGAAAKFGLGLQARISRSFSLGAFYDRTLFWSRDNDLAVPRFIGLEEGSDSGHQNRFGATVTFHF